MFVSDQVRYLGGVDDGQILSRKTLVDRGPVEVVESSARGSGGHVKLYVR